MEKSSEDTRNGVPIAMLNSILLYNNITIPDCNQLEQTMLKLQNTVAAAILTAATAAHAAEGPAVVSDIRPVHSLVSMIMEGVGEPSLLMPSGGSPHGYSMTPSDARLLENADIIIRVGPDLIPPLERNIKSIAPDTANIILLDIVESSLLPPRTDLIFRHDSEDDHDHETSDSGHDDHEEHGNDDDHDHEAEEAAHEDEEHEDGHNHDEDIHEDGHDDEDAHEDGHDHDHHGHTLDPHAWLNPDMAVEWLGAIADVLAAEHPEFSETYLQNAETAIEAIREMSTNLSAELKPYGNVEFIVYHDAYQYFELKFGLNPVGAIKNEHAGDATARHLSELSSLVQSHESICVFAEPQYNQGLINALSDGSNIKTSTLDPIGIDLEPGPELYLRLIERMARNIVECLSS